MSNTLDKGPSVREHTYLEARKNRTEYCFHLAYLMSLYSLIRICDLRVPQSLGTLFFLLSPMADPSRDGRGSVTRFRLGDVTGRC